jgi:hypothetical protein
MLQGAKRATVGVIATASLTACGGGDGTMSNPMLHVPPPGSYNLQAAMQALLKSGATNNVRLSGTAIVNGTSNAFTGTGTLTLGPGSQGAFNGTAALLQTQTITGTVTVVGQSAPYTNSVENAYDSTASEFLGEIQSSEFDVAQAPITIPTSIGTTTDSLGTVSRYRDNTMSVVLGTTQISVVVRFIPVDPGSPEIVQFTFTSYDTHQTVVETDTMSYSLSENNVLTFYSATAQNASGTLTVDPQ